MCLGEPESLKDRQENWGESIFSLVPFVSAGEDGVKVIENHPRRAAAQ